MMTSKPFYLQPFILLFTILKDHQLLVITLSESTAGLSHSTGTFNLCDNVQVHAAHRLENLECD